MQSYKKFSTFANFTHEKIYFIYILLQESHFSAVLARFHAVTGQSHSEEQERSPHATPARPVLRRRRKKTFFRSSDNASDTTTHNAGHTQNTTHVRNVTTHTNTRHADKGRFPPFWRVFSVRVCSCSTETAKSEQNARHAVTTYNARAHVARRGFLCANEAPQRRRTKQFHCSRLSDVLARFRIPAGHLNVEQENNAPRVKRRHDAASSPAPPVAAVLLLSFVCSFLHRQNKRK